MEAATSHLGQAPGLPLLAMATAAAPVSSDSAETLFGGLVSAGMQSSTAEPRTSDLAGAASPAEATLHSFPSGSPADSAQVAERVPVEIGARKGAPEPLAPVQRSDAPAMGGAPKVEGAPTSATARDPVTFSGELTVADPEKIDPAHQQEESTQPVTPTSMPLMNPLPTQPIAAGLSSDVQAPGSPTGSMTEQPSGTTATQLGNKTEVEGLTEQHRGLVQVPTANAIMSGALEDAASSRSSARSLPEPPQTTVETRLPPDVQPVVSAPLSRMAEAPTPLGGTSAPTAINPPPVPLTSSLGHHVGIAIARRVAAGDDEVIVHLDPPALGRIKVQLMFEQGTLRATLSAESALVVDSLQQGSGELARALYDAGVPTDQRSFRFERESHGGAPDRGALTGQHHQQQQQQQQQSGTRQSWRSASIRLTSDLGLSGLPETIPANLRGRLNLFA